MKHKNSSLVLAQNQAVQQNLGIQFKRLFSKEKAPEDLKEQVFDTLERLTLFADLVDLFIGKFPLAEAEIINSLEQTSQLE